MFQDMKALLEALRPGTDEWTLARSLDPTRLPAHVAIIMDGNGRWAKRRSLPRVAGHKAGIASVRSSVETCAQLGLKALTLYAFSVENWKRPRPEVETLWRLLRVYLRRELPTLQKNNIRLAVIGRADQLSETVRRDLAATCAATASNTGLRLTLAINYGGRAELADAVRQIALEVQKGALSPDDIREEHISARLYTADLPDPDLLIRTSGEMRVSNFLLWQIAYAELYVTDTLWPDFTRLELLRALIDFEKRDRRFGGLSAVRSPEEEPVAVPNR
jgi:undecaprenyl diphosphate synthase